ncbi:AMP-binding protein [Oxalicibacterium faecigallinarum]|uniref:AMP-dependent synthetase/ligase domain-containing protein n=1 Tax=Oxalicibacterium faecigallinarum TaxID=573741 RepID=A0A8J3ATC9_9BURK|nr:AMP-binding protein [Oxalicibacterium faecigallinarum]GGI18564.1 hypothetical protein GCM10008066_14650 [Oxalicibacterium faecigallinarum]
MKQDLDLFALLRQQAVRLPLDIATDSPRRAISFRRFWSRIERATARLQGEWHVEPGDHVVYWGNAHPDALILLVAVARCGARLLPLERSDLRQQASVIWEHYQPKAVVHDDGLLIDSSLHAAVITSLPSMLSVRCHHDEDVEENDALPSLVDLHWEAGQLQARTYSLHALAEKATMAEHLQTVSGATCPVQVQEELFNPHLLSSRIFPALLRGETVTFV